MNYDQLTMSYWNSQIDRVSKAITKINQRQGQLPSGKVVPDEENLVIGSGRRMKVAIMFIDISGFSNRHSENEIEQSQMLDILNLFFTEMIRISEDYGGTVEKNTGDGLMAYFEDGGGTPPENGAKRAVSCALTMMHTSNVAINYLKFRTPETAYNQLMPH